MTTTTTTTGRTASSDGTSTIINGTSYQQILSSDDDYDADINEASYSAQQRQQQLDVHHQQQQQEQSHRIVRNFMGMSILFSANHGCTVACLSLATARFAAVGAWQSGILYIFYTGSGLFGATYVVKSLGDRDALICGMALYCCYVGAFWLATVWSSQERIIAYLGAAIGGIGAGFLWAAQGAFFTRASQLHAKARNQALEVSTNRLAAMFAFVYLVEEVSLRGLSSLLLTVLTVPWSAVFGAYALVALLSTIGMLFVERFNDDGGGQNELEGEQQSWWYRSTAAVQLLKNDPKMKHMIGLNAIFGMTSAFLNSYVNGEVSRVVLQDDNSTYVGFLTAWLAAVAAIMSVVLAKSVVPVIGKGPVLIFGALCFGGVALPFLLVPDLSHWTPLALIVIYSLHGIGRATFESTLKAVFADFFYYEKEGAFANIILQSGLTSAIGYVLTFSLTCQPSNDKDRNSTSRSHFTSSWCVEYHDGTNHNVGVFELLVLATCALAIVGYLRASNLHRHHVDNDDDEAAVSPLTLDHGSLSPQQEDPDGASILETRNMSSSPSLRRK